MRTKLSPREQQVLEGIGAGKRIVEIARELGITQQAVSTYRRTLLLKLGFKTNADLVLHVAGVK